MEIIADKIAEELKIVHYARDQIKPCAQRKAKAISDYEKKLAVTIIKLKNGQKLLFEGQEIVNPGTTLTEKIARGYCWKEKLEVEEATSAYNSLYPRIEISKLAINAYLSMNKIQKEM